MDNSNLSVMIVMLVGLIIGLVLGGAALWFYFKNQLKQAAAIASTEWGPKEASLNERINAKDADIARLNSSLTELASALEKLRTDYTQSESERSRVFAQLETERSANSTQLDTERKSYTAQIEAQKNSFNSQMEAERDAFNSSIKRLEVMLNDAQSARDTLEEAVKKLKSENSALSTQIEADRTAMAEKLELMENAKTVLLDTFKSLSSDVLKSSNSEFIQLAKSTFDRIVTEQKGDLDKRQVAITELVKPIRESLDKFDTKVQEIEKQREGAYQSITEQVKNLMEGQKQLASETQNLVNALRKPNVRGRWGEIQLRRVVEMAGMVEYCDFQEQDSTQSEEGHLRPDLIVRLPNNRTIVVDSKTPLQAYLEALETNDENIREVKLIDHARHLKAHITKLSSKQYWAQYDPAPDFVVMFIPGETFYNAALEKDPKLIELSVENGVLLTTPTSLIGLLKAVAFGWRQERIQQNAAEISDLGKTLYERIAKFSEHFGKIGKNLDNAVDNYNKAVGTLETRVLTTARKFKELGATNQNDIDVMEPVEHRTRELQSPDLKMLPNGEE